MKSGAELGQAHELILQTHACFAAMVSGATCSADSLEPGLGGTLFWAGELDQTGRALVMAANVAGATTLVSTLDREEQRDALHTGVVDFLVNSLDEALRILKNEVRKRATVAVCVSASPQSLDEEMRVRGVEPDMLREGIVRASQRERAERSRVRAGDNRELVAWRVAAAPAVWLPKLDALALACLRPEETMARRWVRLSPRYLGRLAYAEHLVWSDRVFRDCFVARLREESEHRVIAVRGEVEVWSPLASDRFAFGAPGEEN